MSTSGYGQSTLIAEKDKRIFELEKQNRKLQQALNNQSHRHGKAVNDLVAQLAECQRVLSKAKQLLVVLPDDALGIGGSVGVSGGELIDCTYSELHLLLNDIDAAMQESEK